MLFDSYCSLTTSLTVQQMLQRNYTVKTCGRRPTIIKFGAQSDAKTLYEFKFKNDKKV